jgi:hypothetical protein
LVEDDNGNGDFEISVWTNLEGSRLRKRLWVGADAIAQAAERWPEPGPECRVEIKYQPKGSGRNLRTIEEATQDV